MFIIFNFVLAAFCLMLGLGLLLIINLFAQDDFDGEIFATVWLGVFVLGIVLISLLIFNTGLFERELEFLRVSGSFKLFN